MRVSRPSRVGQATAGSPAEGGERRGGLIVLAIGFAMGSNLVATRLAIQEIPPLVFAALRLGVSAALFAAASQGFSRLPRHPRSLGQVGLAGLLNIAAPVVGFSFALQFISSGTLAILLGLSPLLAAGMARRWLPDERLGRPQALGLLMGFAGVVLLVATRTTGLATGPSGGEVAGYAVAIGAVLAATVGKIYVRVALGRLDSTTLTAGQVLAAFAATLLAAVLTQPSLTQPGVAIGAVGWPAWLALLYGGAVGSFLGFLLIFRTVQRYGATTATLAQYVEPFAATGLGVLLLGELVTGTMLAGGALILAGVFLSSRPRRLPA